MAGVSTATGFAANVSSNVLSGIGNKVVQVVKIIISLPQAVIDMKDQAQRLQNVVDGIKEKLAQEQKPPQRIVKAWLDKAGEAIESSRSIGNEYEQLKNCLSCCPNCFGRYRISNHIGDWNLKVARLHSEKESDFPPNGEYCDLTPQSQIPILTPIFFGDRIQAAQSELENWLTEDTNIRVIGVHGMGGVGKTSLLQAINNSNKVRESFELIIWITVSKDYEIVNLQNVIASRLNLKLPEVVDKSNLEARKHVISSYLKDKIYLVILDDMWKRLELQDVGVSLNGTASKIVLSTRSKAVCAQMRVDKIKRVEPLSEEVGWQLFCSRAFQNGNVPPELEDVARKIAGQCKGLPLAINVIASAMVNYSYQHEWEHALHQMQSRDETLYDMHDEIEEHLFQRLKWSYNVLPDYMKTCFLYFAAYPEDAHIRVAEVIHLWVAEGLLKGSGESYLPDTADSFIKHLTDRSLIEVAAKDLGWISLVKMHDVLRDFAIRVAEKEQKRSYLKAGQGVSDFPSEEDSEGCARMSLMRNDLHSLPTTFVCSSLSVLLLEGNRGIKEVPGSFLSELSSLRVLDLRRTGVTSLPPSIGNLKHLVSLQLEETAICELPETIGDLKELQFLNVRHCEQLRCLPERIRELKRLRALDMWGCKTLSHLPRGISELVSLERLWMWGSIPLDFEEYANEERKYVCLKDLQSLSRLREFNANIKSQVKEGVIGKWSKMRCLGLNFKDANQNYLPQDMQAMKDLVIFHLEGCDVERLPSWVSEFTKLTHLWLVNCNQLKELTVELQLPCLRVLWIGGCEKLEELELGMGFPKLEDLYLDNLDSLERVGVVAAAASGSGESPLPMLKSVNVRGCSKLKTLYGGWDKLKYWEEIRRSLPPGREWWDRMIQSNR